MYDLPMLQQIERKPKVKGNLVVGQAGLPTAVMNASLYGAIQAAKAQTEIGSIYGMRFGLHGLRDGNLVDLGQQKPEALESLKQTPAAALGVSSDELTETDCERILETCKKHRIRFLVYMGDSAAMQAVYRLSAFVQSADYPLNCMGVPHSVENDLGFTDHCFGYGTAAKWHALMARHIGRNAEAHRGLGGVTLIEVGGKATGWLAAATALGRDDVDSAPHLMYLPERVFDTDRFLADVEAVYQRLGYCCVTVSEGVAQAARDSISEKLNVPVHRFRLNEFSRIVNQPASEVDSGEALMAGQAAVYRAADGMNGFMITISRHIDPNRPYSSAVGMVRLRLGANADRPVPEQFISETGNDVTEAFVNYAHPLLGEDLPTYPRLENIPVEAEGASTSP